MIYLVETFQTFGGLCQTFYAFNPDRALRIVSEDFVRGCHWTLLRNRLYLTLGVLTSNDNTGRLSKSRVIPKKPASEPATELSAPGDRVQLRGLRSAWARHSNITGCTMILVHPVETHFEAL